MTLPVVVLLFAGVCSHMGAAPVPADYLALPSGAGQHVTVCGQRCLPLVSTDIGPSLAFQRAGRVADVSVALFRSLCGDPSRGLCEVRVLRVLRSLAR